MKYTVALLVAVIVGCHAKHEATSATGFLAKYREAAESNDLDTLWRMSMTASQRAYALKYFDELSAGDKNAWSRRAKSGYLRDLPKGLSAEEIRHHYLRGLANYVRTDWADLRIIEERDGRGYPGYSPGKLVIGVTDRPGLDHNFELVLLEEEGFLTYDETATVLQNVD